MATHRLDEAAVRRLLTARNGGVARDMRRRADRVLAEARRGIGVDTGRSRRSLYRRDLPAPGFPGQEVGSDYDAVKHYLRGHGVIVPKRAKVLAFRPKGSNRIVFTRRVGPVRGNPFLQRALRRGARG